MRVTADRAGMHLIGELTMVQGGEDTVAGPSVVTDEAAAEEEAAPGAEEEAAAVSQKAGRRAMWRRENPLFPRCPRSAHLIQDSVQLTSL